MRKPAQPRGPNSDASPLVIEGPQLDIGMLLDLDAVPEEGGAPDLLGEHHLAITDGEAPEPDIIHDAFEYKP